MLEFILNLNLELAAGRQSWELGLGGLGAGRLHNYPISGRRYSASGGRGLWAAAKHLTAGEHEARETSACESNSIQLYWEGVALQGNSRHTAPGGRYVYLGLE